MITLQLNNYCLGKGHWLLEMSLSSTSFLTFDFFLSLSILSVQSSLPLQRWQTWCRKPSLTSWSTGLMGGEKHSPFHAFSPLPLQWLWPYVVAFLSRWSCCMLNTDSPVIYTTEMKPPLGWSRTKVLRVSSRAVDSVGLFRFNREKKLPQYCI